MKKLTFLGIWVTLFALLTNITAANWVYDSGTSKWVKDITPSMFKFNSLTTAQVQSNIFCVLGGANPNPAITSTSGQDLSDGYFAVCGGQISSTDQTMLTKVRDGFNTLQKTLGDVTQQLLRFASNTATIEEGTKCGVTGYVNPNWYIPTQYDYTNYKINFIDSVYTDYSINLLVYGEGGTQIGTTQTLSAGWKTATFTQTTDKPFRFKYNCPNTPGLICYFTNPKLTLTSDAEPAARTVTVNKTGNGTVTAAYGNLHDQDVEVFTLTPGSGETLNSVTYNGETVTPTDNGNGTYTYTTPLLTADGTLNVSFSGVDTGVENQLSITRISTVKGFLEIDGLVAGEAIHVYSAGGKLIHASVATASSKRVDLSHGVYILKIGSTLSKIVL
ncbi:MAG: hypothetical protein PHG64_07795 [Paludibacter sp.]|nr:hypothetical protein [Paludibacter sp.]